MTGRGRPVRAIIAEDEIVLRKELFDHLSRLWPELAIVGAASDGLEALAMIERLKPEVAFLDIQMPGLTGIQVAGQAAGRCHVVFVTAYDSYAIAAFEQGAIDYLLKPYDLLRLDKALERVRSKLEAAPPTLQSVLDELARVSPPRNFLRWIKASSGHDVRLIMVDEICYFQADTKYTTVFTARDEAIIRMSLKQLRAQLDPDIFWSIHRSTIVNANAIRSVTRGLDSSMHILLKERPERLSVSETSRHLFRQM